MKIAIIDDGVNEEKIIYGDNIKIQSFCVKNNKIECCGFEHTITHGTLCAAILCKYLTSGNLYSIKVKEYSSNGKVENLICAIQWCITQKINVISMSLGTQSYSDFTKVNCVTRKLLYNNIYLVSAQSNEGKYTLPACLNNVIGVESHHKNAEIILKSKKCDLGINIQAYGIRNINLDNTAISLSDSNSYACAYMAAKVANTILSKGKHNIGKVLYKVIDENIGRKRNILKCFRLDGIYKPIILGENSQILYQYINCKSYTMYSYDTLVGESSLVREIIVFPKEKIAEVFDVLEKMQEVYLLVYCGKIPRKLRLYLVKRKILYWEESNSNTIKIKRKIKIPIIVFKGKWDQVISSVEKIAYIFEKKGFDVGKISNIKYCYLYGYEYYSKKKQFWACATKCQEFFQCDLILVAVEKWKMNIEDIKIDVLNENIYILEDQKYEQNIDGLISKVIKMLS